MNSYSDLGLHDLSDLLVKHTSEYTKMLSHGILPVEEFAQCKQMLAELQDAIELNMVWNEKNSTEKKQIRPTVTFVFVSDFKEM